MRLTALDTGKKTGIAVWKDGEHEAFDLPAHEAMVWLACILRDDPPNELICEQLIITANTHKKSQDLLIAIEQLGVARYLAFCHGVNFHTQTPSEAKSFATDHKLRALGLWTKGTDHARDATRHIVTRLAQIDPEFAADLAGKI